MEKQQILIVDDEEINRAVLMEMFQNQYDTIEAENGEDAISKIEKYPGIVLILLDIIMPVMDGFAVLEYLQEKNLLDEIPVILITSEAIRDSEDRAYAYGAAEIGRASCRERV